MISITNYWNNIDALYVLIKLNKQSNPFDIQQRIVVLNNDILNVLHDLLS